MVAPVRSVKIQEVDFASYDEIIDVRTPNEFTQDHVPNAVSLPVLDNEEHADVGTMYAQISAFEARKHGGSLVSTNIGKHLKEHFQDKDKNYKPLVYCWRGGQRSNSFGLVLAQVGWPVDVVEGGYKAFRSFVREELVRLAPLFNFKILVGLTGSGKTVVLNELEKMGAQTLDLEGCANHQGSLLGQMPDKQIMNQKAFETRVWHKLSTLDPNKPVWVEGESSKIGKVFIPQPLFSHLCASPSYELVVPRSSRVEHIINDYPHWLEDKDGLLELLIRLKPRYGGDEFELWQNWTETGQWKDLVGRLLEHHYDKSYLNSRGNLYGSPEAKFNLSAVQPEPIDTLVAELLKL
ncbi:MAG: tRNA 2-selenouridine(34) synthase MnmH [Alphaproteobacteria bacterium]